MKEEWYSYFNKGMAVANYFYWFVLANFYFLLVNVPIIEIYLNFDLNFENLPIFFIALIPSGFSIPAMYALMGKLVREKQISVTRDFFRYYFMNMKETVRVWVPSLLMLFGLFLYSRWVELEIIHWIVIVTSFIFVGFLMVLFPILARFSFSFGDLIKVSFYYFLKNINLAIGGISIFIISYLLVIKVSYFFILVISSFPFYMIALMFNRVLKEIEDKINSKFG